MAKKYKIVPGFEKSEVVTSKPLSRDSGRFVLSKCSQADLKYLHDVVKYEGVILEENDTSKGTEESGK